MNQNTPLQSLLSYDIKITGSGTFIDLIDSLKSIVASLECNLPGIPTEYEDSILCAEINTSVND